MLRIVGVGHIDIAERPRPICLLEIVVESLRRFYCKSLRQGLRQLIEDRQIVPIDHAKFVGLCDRACILVETVFLPLCNDGGVGRSKRWPIFYLAAFCFCWIWD